MYPARRTAHCCETSVPHPSPHSGHMRTDNKSQEKVTISRNNGKVGEGELEIHEVDLNLKSRSLSVGKPAEKQDVWLRSYFWPRQTMIAYPSVRCIGM